MANDIFEALDHLKQDIRVNDAYGEVSSRSVRAPSVSARYLPYSPSYEGLEPQYKEPSNDIEHDEYDDGLEDALDAFDENLLRQPTQDRRSRAAAAVGMTRIPLPRMTRDTSAYQPSNFSDLSPFAYRPPVGTPRSSSPMAAASSSPSTRPQACGSQIRQRRGPPRHIQRESYIDTIVDQGGRPVVQGIPIVPTTDLPDRLRSVFGFETFNAIQSKCFPTIFGSDDNFVLSSPTGSGKTAIFDLAICRLVVNNPECHFKVVYQAPTKALCSERARDWTQRLTRIGLTVEEITGDSNNTYLRNVNSANIVITTPEKWDSLTRRWKDNEGIMRQVKLFLIDEVHLLKEDRGATLEAVVSRMKSVKSDVRFVAISATVRNQEDVAAWLGKNSAAPARPAASEKFGEEFRPVLLKKHVVGYSGNVNDFAFDKLLTSKLAEVISKYSHRRPILIFCCTRKSTVETAKQLASWWSASPMNKRFWSRPDSAIRVTDGDLQACANSAVAFHHGGLDSRDRAEVEKGFLNGNLRVICSTSTLAVGVNMPCQMVIIKGTFTWQGTCSREYADTEIIQMLGRAGRPQFDTSAVAVIMARQSKVGHFETMVSGQEILESCMHLNLIDHLNSEIVLGTIKDTDSAKKWLRSTFLYVRLKQNSDHYKLEGLCGSEDVDEQLEGICSRDLSLLRDHELIQDTPMLQSTEFGDAMARYYVHFDTMKAMLAIPSSPKLSEIFSAIVQASEFAEIRFRAGEKTTYRELNKSNQIKFPIQVDLSQPAHKVSLIVQAILGGTDLAAHDNDQKLGYQFNIDKATIFRQLPRLIRCIIDCQLHLQDAVGARNALSLARSFGSHAWDDSPWQLKQIESLGPVAVRKLMSQGIRSIDDLEDAPPHRLETILTRNPPFGLKLLEKVKVFPKLRVGVRLQGYTALERGEGVRVDVRAEIGFMNEKTPIWFQKKRVYACFLAEVTGGQMAHFCRISGEKMRQAQEVSFSTKLTSADQSITCYLMCDDIGGTLRHATLTPEIPASLFPISKPRKQHKPWSRTDDYGYDDINDDEMLNAVKTKFSDAFLDIDEFSDFDALPASKRQRRLTSSEPECEAQEWQPRRLANGKWACNHRCINKGSCKHLCCRDGLDRPPKAPASKAALMSTTRKDRPNDAVVPSNSPKMTQKSLARRKQQIHSPLKALSNGRTTSTQKGSASHDNRGMETLDLTGGTLRAKQPAQRLEAVAQKPIGFTAINASNRKASGASLDPVEQTPKQRRIAYSPDEGLKLTLTSEAKDDEFFDYYSRDEEANETLEFDVARKAHGSSLARERSAHVAERPTKSGPTKIGGTKLDLTPKSRQTNISSFLRSKQDSARKTSKFGISSEPQMEDLQDCSEFTTLSSSAKLSPATFPESVSSSSFGAFTACSGNGDRRDTELTKRSFGRLTTEAPLKEQQTHVMPAKEALEPDWDADAEKWLLEALGDCVEIV